MQSSSLKTFKLLIFFLSTPLIFIFSGFTANAQEVHEDEIEAGKVLSEKVQNNEVQCSSLKDSDFENLGEFYMEQMLGTSQRHTFMDKHIERMHGKEGLDKMHISLGKYYSGCDKSSFMPFGMGFGMMTPLRQGFVGQEGGDLNMMGPGFGFSNMMGGYGGFFGIFGFIYWILILVILVLIAAWLWKQVQKK